MDIADSEKRDSVAVEMSELDTEGGSDTNGLKEVEQIAKDELPKEEAKAEEPISEEKAQSGSVALSEEEKEVFKAVLDGDLTKLKKLVEQLDSLPTKNEEGNPLIHFAAKAGKIEIVAFLLEKQADINSTNANGTTPLHLAAFSGFNEIVELLVHYGADMNRQDTSGNTALHFACQFNQPETARMLINYGERFDLVNSIGDIPLHGACRNGMVPVVMRLCELGCPVNNSNGHGDTPLHLASKSGICEAVRTLLLHGASLDVTNKDGKTAEDLATDAEVLKLFSLYNQVMQSSSQNKKFEMRKQLSSNDKPMSRLKIAVLGNTGVGKTTFVESLKCGFLKSLLWSSYYTVSKATKAPKDPANKPLNYTKGVDIHNTSLSDVGDVTIYDYSGCQTYLDQYSLFLGDSSTIHIVVVSMEDPKEVRFGQLDFWLEFIRLRMIPKEPIGFAGCNMWAPNVFVVATNADDSNSVRNQKGEWTMEGEEKSLSLLVEKYEREIIVNSPACVLDAQLPGSPEMKDLRRRLAKLKGYMQNFLPTQVGCLEQTRLELPGLTSSLSSFPVVGFKEFADFVRRKVNLLASDDVVKELIVQLQLMGEIICYGLNPDEIVVLNPAWLGGEIVGRLFSPDTIRECHSSTGFVPLQFLRNLFQKCDFVRTANLLKALNICYERTTGSSDSSSNSSSNKEYYIHAYNRADFRSLCKDWPESWRSAAVKSAVRLVADGGVRGQLEHLFSHVICALRVVFAGEGREFGQWRDACRVSEGGRTAVVTVDGVGGHIEVACHSADRDDRRGLFAFSETICAVVHDSADRQCPGLFLRRWPASWADCSGSASVPPRFYEPSEILLGQLESPGSDVRPPAGGDAAPERLVDVLTFGSEEAFGKVVVGTEAHVTCLSHQARCRLAWHLDKDLELCRRLAREMEVDERIVPVEQGSVSVFDRMLAYWSADASVTVRRLCGALKSCCADEALRVLLEVTPVFVYLPGASLEGYEDEK